MLDNRRVACFFPPAYYLGMAGIAFRDRVLSAMKDKGISKAELSRQSRVPYHALDKFLKREGATTSTENAIALAGVLKISVDSAYEYDEVKSLYSQLDEEQKKFVLMSIRGLLS